MYTIERSELTSVTKLCLAIAGTMLLAACAASQASSGDQRYNIDAATRAKIQAAMGDEYLRDLDVVYAAGRERQSLASHERSRMWDPTPAAHCLEEALKGATFEKKGNEQQAAVAYQNCAYSCKNESERANSPFKAIVDKYKATCVGAHEKRNALRAVERFDSELPTVDAAQGAFNRREAVAKLRGALQSAERGLGTSDERVTSRRAKLTAIESKYREELDRAEAFLARDDVKRLRLDIDRTKASVEDYRRTHMDSRRRQAEDELRRFEAKYSFLIREAGL